MLQMGTGSVVMAAFVLGLGLGVVLSPWLGPPLRRGVDWIAAHLRKETADGKGSEKGS